ncbi:Uncharacterised protein [Serratia proteamaculans]|nr:Uncharacterised protein [Serratia proteamaculans]
MIGRTRKRSALNNGFKPYNLYLLSTTLSPMKLRICMNVAFPRWVSVCTIFTAILKIREKSHLFYITS